MAKLPPEATTNINRLKQQSLEIVDKATAVEFMIFERFGENERTISFFEELTTVAEDAKSSFSRLSNLQLSIAEIQPVAAPDMLELLTQVIARTITRIPAWERSIEEVQIELNMS